MSVVVQRQDKFRRSLKEIQLSADEESFVGNSMICPDDKSSVTIQQSKAVGRVIVAEKENAPAVRRSKRKPAAEKVIYAESPLELKSSKSKNTQAKKTVTKSRKKRSAAVKKNEQKAGQTKLHFSPVTSNTKDENPPASFSDDHEKLSAVSTENNEDSGFDPTSGISAHSPMNSTIISKAHSIKSSSVIPSDISIITTSSPPLSYWKDLAEQRRVALENALHENELLHDQLEVLEAENTKLKEEVKAAENLAEVVRAILD